MLGESLRVPFRTDDWIGTILVGSVLTLLVGLFVAIWGVLLVLSPAVGGVVFAVIALPSLVLRGYLLGVVRSGLRGDPTVDSFVQWGLLVRNGARSTLISAIYLIPAAVLCGLALGGGVATVVSPDGFEGAVQAISALVILTGGFGFLLYGMVYLYVRPAARAVFASTGSVRAALGVRRVVRLSITADYISGWLIGMGILVVGPTILLPLLAISLVVAAVSPPLAFVGILSTILLGIGLVFVCRVSAAWATGRGSATGVAALFPTAHKRVDESTTLQPTRGDVRSHEVSAAVQTGRTVRAGGSSTPDETDTDERDPVLPTPSAVVLPVRRRENELSGAPVHPRQLTNGSAAPDDSQPVDADGDRSVDESKTDTDADADGNTGQSVDSKDDNQDDSKDDNQDDSKDDNQDDNQDDSEDDFVWGPTDK